MKRRNGYRKGIPLCWISSVGRRMGRTSEMETRRTESKWSKPLNSQTDIDMRCGERVLYFFKKKKKRKREEKEE